MKFGDILKPTGGARIVAESFGKNLTTEQTNMLNDWDQGKFQKSDVPLARGVLNQSVDNFMHFGLPIAERSGEWFDRNTNTFGDSEHGMQ